MPTDLTEVPTPALAGLSDKLRIPIGELRTYGTREQTRSDHLREVARHLKWRPMKEPEAKELETYLLARAMEHDSPSALFRAACAHLRSACVIRPGPVWLLERVVAAREAAKAETYHRIEPLLTQVLRLDLDHLLRVDPKLGSTRLHWLSHGATQAAPNAVNTVARLSEPGRTGQGQCGLPAVLGAVGDRGAARRAEVGGRARASLTPLCRPGLLPDAQGGVGGQAHRVLRRGRHPAGGVRGARPGR